MKEWLRRFGHICRLALDSNKRTITVCYGARLNSAFVNEAWNVCKSLGWDRKKLNYLLACIAFETAGTFKPNIRNFAGSGATGLIQFMPSTAKGLGVTVDDLARMSAVEQLFYVEMYFRHYANRIQTLEDMYMAILMPKYVGASNNAIIFSGETKAYRQNSGLDVNSDGQVTKREVSKRVVEYYNKGMSTNNSKMFTLWS